MKKILLTMIMSLSLFSQELKIEADSFSADQTKGLSTFTGNVKIVKYHDALSASQVIIYTNKKNAPLKFVATGNVTFKIETKTKQKYEGKAERVVFLAPKKEYHFYKNVHLKQIDERKEIQGDEVVLNIEDGKAHAKGVDKDPVIMIFDIPEEKK